MSEESQAAKGGAGKWFLKKFFISPATWAGLSAGIAAGLSLLHKGPLGGAIGFGSMVGVGTGALFLTVVIAVRAMHKKNRQSAELADRQNTELREQFILADLCKAGRTDDAALLEKMFADRDAVLKQCRGREDDADAAHTVELASAIISESCLQAEELQDLHRRAQDPLLDGPDGAEAKIEEIRAELQRAYQAVANARSRLRRGESLSEIDFLADSASVAAGNLAALTGRLEEETAIAKRVEQRMRPDRAGWMDADGERDSAEPAVEELGEYE